MAVTTLDGPGRGGKNEVRCSLRCTGMFFCTAPRHGKARIGALPLRRLSYAASAGLTPPVGHLTVMVLGRTDARRVTHGRTGQMVLS